MGFSLSESVTGRVIHELMSVMNNHVDYYMYVLIDIDQRVRPTNPSCNSHLQTYSLALCATILLQQQNVLQLTMCVQVCVQMCIVCVQVNRMAHLNNALYNEH